MGFRHRDAVYVRIPLVNQLGEPGISENPPFSKIICALVSFVSANVYSAIDSTWVV